MNAEDPSSEQNLTATTDPSEDVEPEGEPIRPAHAIAREPAAAAGHPSGSSDSGPLLDHLLKLADEFRAKDALRQAMEIYFMLAEVHEDTPQGSQARQWLMAIAEHYEHIGGTRQARSIYERLL